MPYMNNNQEKHLRLFSIPVYLMGKKEHGERVEAYKRGLFPNVHDSKLKEKYCKLVIYPRNLWKYNYIVGYLEVVIIDLAIELVFYNQIKSTTYLSAKKCFLEEKVIPQYHIERDIYSFASNEEIAETIRKKLKEFIETFIKKNRYVDLEIFDATYKYIDYLSLFNNLDKE